MNIPSTTPGTLPRAMIRRLAALSALALTVFGVSVPAASADDQRIRTNGGEVNFNDAGGPVGNNVVSISAIDKRRDGYAVRAYLQWTDRDGVHATSVTDPRSTGKGDAKDVVILSGTAVLLSMCYIDNGHIKQCSFSQPAAA
jgi:hypothetical protein